MENTKKENFVSKIINKIKKGWASLGEIDINDGMDKDVAKEVERLEQVQVEVSAQRSFVPKAQVNEGKAQVSAKGRSSRGKGDTQRVHGNA